MKTSPYTHMSCFDLDHTLLKVNSSFQFGAYLYRQKIFPLVTMLYLASCYFLHKAGLLSMEQMQKKIFNKLFRKLTLEQLNPYAKAFLDQHFNEMLFPPAVQRLKEAQKQGHYTCILSSSPQFLVKLFSDRFNVDACAGTRYELDHNQRFLSIAHLMQGQDKADYITLTSKEMGLTKQQITAYSDSVLDIDFLRASGTPVGVKPDKKLRHICTKLQWQIIE